MASGCPFSLTPRPLSRTRARGSLGVRMRAGGARTGGGVFPSPTKGEGGVWASWCPKRERVRAEALAERVEAPAGLEHLCRGARRRRAHRRWRLSRSWSGAHDSRSRRRASPWIAEGVWSLSKYSSSHKDWACWAGLHPPSNADALCAIPPRAPRLYVHQTSSRGGSAVPARTAGRGCTRRRTRAPCATRQIRTMVNVSENCYNPPKPAQASFAFHSRGLMVFE